MTTFNWCNNTLQAKYSGVLVSKTGVKGTGVNVKTC